MARDNGLRNSGKANLQITTFPKKSEITGRAF